MSIIPKISVGLPKKREKFSVNFDNSTTSNIGNIQPTMCREMVPNEKFTVGVDSLVRLASMPLPTFGRMSLRHNHVFVSCQELYQPFDAMLSGQHYSAYNATGAVNFIPTRVPSFNMKSILPLIMSYSDMTIYPNNNLENPLKIDLNYTYLYGEGVIGDPSNIVTKELSVLAESGSIYANFSMTRQKRLLEEALNAIRQAAWFDGALAATSNTNQMFKYGAGSLADDAPGVIRAGDFYVSLSGNSAYSLDFDYIDNADDDPANWTRHSGNVHYDASGTVITPESADLITKVGSYMVCLKFKAPIKRLRTIFIGLGYQFSPYNSDVEFSVLKLLAYYKSWFSLFRPDREKSFVDTNCYKVIKLLSESNGFNISNPPSGAYGSAITLNFTNFLLDLMRDCYYYLPMDYFGMSVVKPQQSNSDTAVNLGTAATRNARNDVGALTEVTVKGFADGSTDTDNSVGITYNATSPLVQRLAQRLLTFANKNTVIGRNIRDYLKVHYGVADVDPIDAGEVVRIGTSRVKIEISDVMSTAENTQGFLGEYAGRGIGYGNSEEFSYTTDKFGFWITLTVVVPESGYFQGYLKENRHLDRFEFFAPEFDALGYQVLERGEVMDSYDCDSDGWKPRQSYTRNAAFGFVPRYSEYKVGRNIVNGDLSLVGLKNSMSPYTLDRRLPSALMGSGVLMLMRPVLNRDESGVPTEYDSQLSGGTFTRPDFVPSVVYDDFRRIDPSDHLGQYNRIFNYASNDLDHFIIHNIFKVDAVAPMKSLSTSFDTYGEEDESSISVDKA